MLNSEAISKEKEHLNYVYNSILEDEKQTKASIKEASDFLSEQVHFSSEDFYAMDEEERAETKTIFDNMEYAVLKLTDKLKSLEMLKKSCYFGSFLFNSEQGIQNVYVGITGFLGKQNFPLVCDWRAPISSVFYDYELGAASYSVMGSKFEGEVLNKRQYKVKENELIYAFNSSLAIGDEILKAELAGARSDKMKNIVSTIQREQNEIIRKPNLKNMLIQGVAGSGKTSIALHRVAYLLYSMRENLSAENVLIVSPSSEFSKYIENVLPELGENMVNSLTFFDIAKINLKNVNIENSEGTTKRLLKATKDELKDYNYKMSLSFLSAFKEYIKMLDNRIFTPKDFVLGTDKISAEDISDLYFDKFVNQTPYEKIANITDYICEQLNIPNSAKNRTFKVLFNQLINADVFKIYEEFIKNNEKITKKSEFKLKNNKYVIYFEDIAPLLLIQNYIYGLNKNDEVKVMVVDEFQEYSPAQFEVLRQIYNCNYIVLGDINQSVFRKLDELYLQELSLEFNLGNIINLNKSYRSTVEISDFNKTIKSVNVENIDRHGDAVEVILSKNKAEEISNLIKNSNFESRAIVVKDAENAKQLFDELKNKINCSLNTLESGKTLITSYENIKGIEFDFVIVADYASENYKSEVDKNILYNITTRATNKLVLIG